MSHTRRCGLLPILAGLAVFFTVVGAPVALAQADLRGGGWSYFSDGGSETGGLPSVNGYPALTGFRYNFKGGDHHIKSIVTTFDTSILGCCSGSWFANYADAGGSSDYWYDMGWLELPPGTTFGRGGIVVKASEEETWLQHWIDLGPATPNTIPVLTGFKLVNYNGDMHLRTINIYFENQAGILYAVVKFSDNSPRNESDKSLFVSYAEVPNDRARQLPHISGRSTGREVSGSLDAQHPVLQGFWMEFDSGDRHIDRLGAQVGAWSWRITFEDSSPKDPYSYGLWAVDILP